MIRSLVFASLLSAAPYAPPASRGRAATTKTRPKGGFSSKSGELGIARALKKLGPLAAGEMYGFVPALAIGGQATLANLHNVPLREHLELPAQTGYLRIIERMV